MRVRITNRYLQQFWATALVWWPVPALMALTVWFVVLATD